MTLFLILLATGGVSALSLVSAWLLLNARVPVHKYTYWLVSLAAGTLMGAAFWHLLPEAIETIDVMPAMTTLVLSFTAFFIIEKVLHWQHCHDTECHEHVYGHLNLIGDAIHNFLDGVTIAAAFVVSPALGLSTTLAIALHEVPQELGDLGVLLHAGFSKRRALLANVLVALTAIVGGVVGWGFSAWAEPVVPYLLPVAAGSFLYIASSDLIPELREEGRLKHVALALGWFGIGLLIMYLALFTE